MRAETEARKNWNAPRTPWGDPDLQGVFTNSNEYATPLERPAEYANKEFFTDEERQAQDDERSGNIGWRLRERRPGDPRLAA